MGFLSMLLLFLTLDSVQLTQKRTIKFCFSYKSKDLSLETMKQLLKKSLEVVLSLKEWKYIDQLFLIPITMWTTIGAAFLTAQFTRVNKTSWISLFEIQNYSFFLHQGFITCLIGIR